MEYRNSEKTEKPSYKGGVTDKDLHRMITEALSEGADVMQIIIGDFKCGGVTEDSSDKVAVNHNRKEN